MSNEEKIRVAARQYALIDTGKGSINDPLVYIAFKAGAEFAAGLNERDEWQPIETVPKDRTMVDLWFVDGKRGKRLVDCEYLHDKWWYGTVNLEHYGKPTHWMLSPTSPKK